MKKFVFFFIVLVASTFLGACSSDDDSISKDVIQPVSLTSGPIVEFFNAELRRSTKSFWYEEYPDRLYGDIPNIACVVNSREELADIYLGEKELPDIDFDKYTLIIGQQMMPGFGFYLTKKELTLSNDGLILTLYTRNDNEVIPDALQHLYFWDLYPKLSQTKVSVTAITEYTNFPDRQ
jgi:hypothetical protein